MSTNHSRLDRTVPLPTRKKVGEWSATLRADEAHAGVMRDARGLSDEVIDGARIGWDGTRYTIPVYGADKDLVNVRRYSPKDHNKMMSLAGYGKGHLYVPVKSPTEDALVLIVEGELDALKAAQELDDVWCVSGTGGAGNPPSLHELEPLRGRDCVIAYDCDSAGATGARKLAERLTSVALSVRIADLALGQGEDVTDWFVKHGRSAEALISLLDNAPSFDAPAAGQGRDFGDLFGVPAARQRRDADELLAIAIDTKVNEEGSRNAAGFWLASQLRDERYVIGEAEPLMLRFAESVRTLKADAYTTGEAMESLRSAYERVPRDAVGKMGASYGFDDIGNAERLVDKHGADIRYVAAYGGWHYWDARRWAEDDSGRVERWAKETARAMKQEAFHLSKSNSKKDKRRAEQLLAWAKTSASAARLGNMMKLAQSEHERATQQNITLPASAFDANPGVFVLQNGTLDLGERAVLRAHQRSDLARRVAAAGYRRGAEAPTWARFLEEALPDEEVRSYLQRLTAYAAFTVGNPHRLLPLLLGPTSTGKTTFGQVMLSILGDYGDTFELSMLRAKQTESPRPDLVSVFSRRFLFTTEASQEWELHADHIKRITGNDSIKVRTLYSGAFVSGIPAFTPFIATNQPPRITGADPALWRRLVVVPFNVSFIGREDDGLRARIETDERDGVMQWLVEGWSAYRRDGLTPPVAVMDATMALRESLSSVDEWIAEHTDQEATAEELFSSLWESFQTWQIVSGIPERSQLTMQRFKAALDDRGHKASGRRRVAGAGDVKQAYRGGLRLTGEQRRVHRGDGGGGS